MKKILVILSLLLSNVFGNNCQYNAAYFFKNIGEHFLIVLYKEAFLGKKINTDYITGEATYDNIIKMTNIYLDKIYKYGYYNSFNYLNSMIEVNPIIVVKLVSEGINISSYKFDLAIKQENIEKLIDIWIKEYENSFLYYTKRLNNCKYN